MSRAGAGLGAFAGSIAGAVSGIVIVGADPDVAEDAVYIRQSQNSMMAGMAGAVLGAVAGAVIGAGSDAPKQVGVGDLRLAPNRSFP